MSVHHYLILISLLLTGCSLSPEPSAVAVPEPASEKAAILRTLNEETIAAFSRDLATWQDKWIHTPYVTKTYLNFSDSSMTETLGWADVNQFVVDYFAAHPEPDPLPEPLKDIEVRLYGNGAWVSYEQQDPARGRKRETRLMEKVAGSWKIAGMQTVIYGQ